MKHILLLYLTLLTISVSAQKSNHLIAYNQLKEIEGTPYVLATFEDWSKKAVANHHLLFINTTNHEKIQVEFSKDTHFEKIEHIRLDSLHINRILVTIRTDHQENDKKLFDLRDRPRKMVLLSPDGREKIALSAGSFFVRTWVLNRYVGTLTITGYYDVNANGKYDEDDKHDILLFDLKTLKPVPGS
ncbi:hypothetical protein [Chitinophaga nivalis]|uniref:Calcium-binding protein n=1 Tax=Chitinophaga nivalis TaxID=2991709 RepID=A0ABT3IJ95_9BACT|nr:hypothetical protein [Chitinophaga nivalis]MCW3466259.1 hypothetical protein [Chitinophaga nivalis]MCW3484050.1 hypothetical protein [Chitinophaga nivalis]